MAKLSAQQRSAIDKVGQDFTLGDKALPTVEAVLYDWAKDYEAEAQKNIQATLGSKSGLANSIRYNVTETGEELKLQISIADYYDFVNKGVKGVKSDKAPGSPYSFKNLGVSYKMVDSIKKWMGSHNLRTVNQKKLFKHTNPGKQFGKDASAYAIAVGVKKGGLKPTLFWDKTYDNMMPELSKRLAAALLTDVTTVLTKIAIVR